MLEDHSMLSQTTAGFHMSCMSRSSRLDGRGWLPPSALWGFAVLQVRVRKIDSSSLWSDNRTYKSTDSHSSLPLSSHRRQWPVIPSVCCVLQWEKVVCLCWICFRCHGVKLLDINTPVHVSLVCGKVAYGEKKSSEYPHWILLRPEHGESPDTVYTVHTVSKSNR